MSTHIPRNVIDGKFKKCGHEANEKNVRIRAKTGYWECRACTSVVQKLNNKRSTRNNQLQGAML